MFVLICEHVFVVFVLILGVCLSEMRLLFSFGTFDSFLAGHPNIVYITVGNIFPLDPNLAQRIQNLALTIHFVLSVNFENHLDLACQFLD